MGLSINDFGNGGGRCQKLVKLWWGLKNADMGECSDKDLNFKSESYNIIVFFFQRDDITIRFWFLHLIIG